MKKYQIIYCDPPWSFNNKNTGGSLTSGASAKYNTMSIKDIKKLDISSITDDNCVLFMWWVGSQPQEALDLVKEWGFSLKTMTGFNWVKQTKLKKLFFGMGFWTRAGSECCLIAVKGKMRPVNRGIRSVLLAENKKHSQKPNEIKERIVQLCGDFPRLEMFAREQTEGWDVFGNEVENSINI